MTKTNGIFAVSLVAMMVAGIGTHDAYADIASKGYVDSIVSTISLTPGPKGDNGSPGAAATVTVGTVTTGAAGTSAAVTNAGTSSAAKFNFTIPRGDKGETGATGATGSVASVTNGAAESGKYISAIAIDPTTKVLTVTKATDANTDTNTVTTATTTGSGNAVTAITATNGALTVTKGSTFLTTESDPSVNTTVMATAAATAGTSGTAGKVYPVQKDSNGKAVVSVPWVDTNTDTTALTKAVSTTAATAAVLTTDSTAVNAMKYKTITAGNNVTISPTADKITISATDTNTTYGAGTSATAGLVKLGSDTVQSVAANGVSATASRTYAVQNNGTGQMVVNVPWVDTNTDTNTTVLGTAATSGTGPVVTGITTSGNVVTAVKGNVQIPIGSATGTTYATIWVE